MPKRRRPSFFAGTRAVTSGGALALFAYVALHVRSARAETLPFAEISVQRAAGAESCPSERELVERTLSLGVARSELPPEPLRIEVSFERRGSDYIAHIRASGRKTGERELRESGPECRPLLDASAVVLSVLLDLLPAEQAAPETPEPVPAVPASPPPTPPPTPAKSAERPAAAERPASPSASWSLGGGTRLAGGAGYGLLGDAVSPWLSGGAFIRLLGMEASLEGFYVPERRLDYHGGVVEVSLLGGVLEACYEEEIQAVSWLRAGGCGGFGLGVLSARGLGFDEPDSSADLWMGAGVSLDARAAFTRVFGARVELSSLFLPVDQTLSVENAGTAFRSSSASVILSLGPELTIW